MSFLTLRDSRGGLLGRQHGLGGVGDNDRRLELDQLGGQGGESVPLVRSIAIRQADVVPLHIAEVAETLPKGIEGEDLGITARIRELRWIVGPEHANQGDVAGLRRSGA
jgi:hypothetical protein